MSVHLRANDPGASHFCAACGSYWRGHHACAALQEPSFPVPLDTSLTVVHERPAAELGALREAVGWLAGAVMILAEKAYEDYDAPGVAVRFKSRIREYKELAGVPVPDSPAASDEQDRDVFESIQNLLEKWQALADGEDKGRSWDPGTVCIELEHSLLDDRTALEEAASVDALERGYRREYGVREQVGNRMSRHRDVESAIAEALESGGRMPIPIYVPRGRGGAADV